VIGDDYTDWSDATNPWMQKKFWAKRKKDLSAKAG
jgi:hypothetical protein